MLLPCLAVTAELALTDLDYRFICEMERFQPFGMGNPRPVFLLQGLFLAGRPRVVGKCHLKFALTDGQHTVDAIWWGAGGLTLPGGSFDVAAQVELNRFRGAETIQLNVQDIRSRS